MTFQHTGRTCADFPQNMPASSNKSLANYCIMLIAVVVCFRACSWPLCSMPRSVCPKRQADCRSAPAAGLMATAHHCFLLNRCLPSPLLHRWSVIWRLVLIQKNMFWIKEASRKWNESIPFSSLTTETHSCLFPLCFRPPENFAFIYRRTGFREELYFTTPGAVLSHTLYTFNNLKGFHFTNKEGLIWYPQHFFYLPWRRIDHELILFKTLELRHDMFLRMHHWLFIFSDTCIIH